MEISSGLDLKNQQSLTMTQQLQQAIKLLQMSSGELSEFINKELDANPLLEVQRDSDEFYGEEGLSAPDQLHEHQLGGSGDVSESYPMMHGVRDAGYAQSRSSDTRNNQDFLDYHVTSKQTLSEYLYSQQNLIVHDQPDRIISQCLIDAVDQNGYLSTEIHEIAEQLSIPVGRVEDVLKRLQLIEPAGLFGRNVKECLTLQLVDQGCDDSRLITLLDFLPDIAGGDFQKIAKATGYHVRDVKNLVREIRKLNPKPGLMFSTGENPVLIPDVIVRQDARGHLIVELNPASLPRVLVNNEYRRVINYSTNSKEKKNLAAMVQSAKWLVKALNQRATTILNVATEIVKQQENFFNHGIGFLKPLTLQDIATPLSIHESTVSRVTTNKYMDTSYGIFELKFFFTSGISDSSGELIHSAETVRQRIKDLIGNEDLKNILSDDKLVQILHKDGIRVARRTVAKYREHMNISSSIQRRKEKRLMRLYAADSS